MIDWIKLILSDDIPEDVLRNRDPSKAIPPLYGALLKNEADPPPHFLRPRIRKRREQRA